MPERKDRKLKKQSCDHAELASPNPAGALLRNTVPRRVDPRAGARVLPSTPSLNLPHKEAPPNPAALVFASTTDEK